MPVRIFPNLPRAAFRRYVPLLALALWYLALCSVTRFALWWSFGSDAQVGAHSLLWIMPAGVIADAVPSTVSSRNWARVRSAA